MRWALLASAFAALSSSAGAVSGPYFQWSVVAEDGAVKPYAKLMTEPQPLVLILSDDDGWDVVPKCDGYLLERPIDLYPRATPTIYRLKNEGRTVVLSFWAKFNDLEIVAPHTERVWECVEGLLP